MVRCEKCGTSNEDGESFCGQCGAYLDWQEKPPPPEPEPVAEPEPEPEPEPQAPVEPEHPTLIERVKQAAGISAPDPGVDKVVPNQAPPAAGPPPAPGTGGVAPAASGTPPPTGTAPVRATAAPVLPGAAAAAPRRRREPPPEERRPLPGETVCPACGAGNVPTRRFCRRCGADLVDAAIVPELPWYRRIFRRSPQRGHLAGDRPVVHRGRRRFWRKVVTTIIVIGVLGAGAWFALPFIGPVGQTVRDRVLGAQIVNPTKITASSFAKGHGPGELRDGTTNRYWAPAKAGAGVGQWVEMTFPEKIRLVRMQVFNGSSEDPKDYLRTARVQTVELRLTRPDGSSDTRSITLADSPGQQDFEIGVSDVIRARMTVKSAYGATPKVHVALGEVAFYKRSS
ncbi:zinc-ribbon domain-containing protein [Intrasporangium sp.]|uniref:NADase-type glycan-binding domain-containing protein n=1 Tax=Intrasporangium sp. TaxID=1925024 RepID=UPI003221A71B